MASLGVFLKKLLPFKLIYLIRYGLFYFKCRGSRYHCPICGHSFGRFLSFGVKARPNVLCPVCGSLERHRLHYLFLKSQTNLFTSDLKILHIAPEACFSNFLSSLKNVTYVSADLMSPYAMKKWDITNLPSADDEFDVILCSHVFEHIPADRKAMGECYRVLKKDGWAILDVPIADREDTYEDPKIVSPEEREREFGRYDHVRLYGRDYVQRLREVGFEVAVSDFVKTLKTEEFSKFSLCDQEIFYCTKKNGKGLSE